MRKIKISELSYQAFRRYGAYVNLFASDNPKLGEQPIEFFRDALPFSLGNQTSPSISVCRISQRPYIIDTSEFHSFTGEVNIPLDGDMLMHVAPATNENEIPLDQIEVYRIPKGTAVMINPGVWHHAAFTVDTDIVNVAVVLPERTYANDCQVCHIAEADHVHIEME